jgi:hypothetical protein
VWDLKLLGSNYKSKDLVRVQFCFWRMQVCQSHKHSSDAAEYDLLKDDIGDCMKERSAFK